jgi:cobalt/nickel transport system permease protein
MIDEPFGGDGRRTFLHRLDPRTKILGSLVFSFSAALIQSLPAAGVAFLFALSVLALARPPAGKTAALLCAANGFVLFLWVFLPFSVPGETVFSAGPFQATREGIGRALLLTVRSNAIFFFTAAFVAATPMAAVARGLEGLGVPVKLVSLFFFTYRYAIEIGKEYTRILNAMRIRCFRPRTNLHTYRHLAFLVGMLLVNSYERGLRVRSAMVCRGFRGRIPVLEATSVRTSDAFALGVLACVLVVVVAVHG